MWLFSPLLVLLLLLLQSLCFGFGFSSQSILGFSRDDFPPDFVFGAGTSAYQYEGAVDVDGKSPSIWDTFTHAGHMVDKSTADVTAGGYYKYKEDVKRMSDIGLEAYRFSISWSRLIPNGRGAINPKGLEYYNNVINELIKHGIQPHVTLYHLDLPQTIEDEYAGWLSPKIVEDFTAYTDVCFREFGDRVRHWTTFNEPNVQSVSSYDIGFFPPERCSYPYGVSNCTFGNSTIEPYIAIHNILLAHAEVAALYKRKYQAKQNGWIGMNVYTFWMAPFTNSTADIRATKRSFDFQIGWVINPLVFGDYPETMKKRAGSRIPKFTKCQSEKLMKSFDFIGINHYTSAYISGDNIDDSNTGLRDYYEDMSVITSVSRNETPSGQFIPVTPPPPDPNGIRMMLEYLKDFYNNPPVYVQENGRGTPYNDTNLNDTERVDFLRGYIGAILEAIRNGSNCRGYIVWSFLDVFEFLSGYQTRYGLYLVDFEDKDLKRQPKLSAHWYSNFIKGKQEGLFNLETTTLHGTKQVLQSQM
ncbi:Beta-glucosidase 22 [Acorus calamus]|uniref:Beta-glucosidase 22 n=1 Tax=Acorus calamus TaxID=4465 RepID=A0AAV9D028_ACOCL|nr:Beta-glucosidase 22 [Acorus calamus]